MVLTVRTTTHPRTRYSTPPQPRHTPSKAHTQRMAPLVQQAVEMPLSAFLGRYVDEKEIPYLRQVVLLQLEENNDPRDFSLPFENAFTGQLKGTIILYAHHRTEGEDDEPDDMLQYQLEMLAD